MKVIRLSNKDFDSVGRFLISAPFILVTDNPIRVFKSV
jgi:hypothetical protein